MVFLLIREEEIEGVRLTRQNEWKAETTDADCTLETV